LEHPIYWLLRLISAEANQGDIDVCLSLHWKVATIDLFKICETLFHPLDSAALLVASIKTEDEKR
jgi:hypothetical protein